MVTKVSSVSEATRALAAAPSPVVVVPVYNGFDDVVQCYESLFRHTPETYAILVVDDAGTDRAPITVLGDLAGDLARDVVVLERQVNGGFVGACNDAFAATPGRDVVVVNSDCVVGPEWLERMSAAAVSSVLVATVSTLTNHGTILSVPFRNDPQSDLPKGMSVDEAARRVADGSVRLRPTVPTAVGHCVYFRRFAIDLLGGFDPIFGTGYGEEVDFSQRVVEAGMRNICADDVFVYHRGGGSFGPDAQGQRDVNEAVVNARYPWYATMVEQASTDECSVLAVALDRARVALTSRRIGIDALALGQLPSASELGILQAIAALVRVLDGAGAADQVHVFHGADLDPRLRALVGGLARCHLHRIEALDPPGHPLVDVVYRPYQVRAPEELGWLRALGRRVVVGQPDTFAWFSPVHFRSAAAWLAQRELVGVTLSTVDGVAFCSDAARYQAEAEGLLGGMVAARVIGFGTDDPSGLVASTEPERPPEMPEDAHPFLLAFAVSRSETRAYCVRLLSRLRERGWDGRLVFAGGTAPSWRGLGVGDLDALGAADLGERVVEMSEVGGGEKRWLYERAALTIHPSAEDGFGLVPFESAAHGVPVLVSTQGSLREVLVGVDAVDGFDLEAATDLAMTLLTDAHAAAQQCIALRKSASVHTWERSGRELLTLMDEVLARRPNPLLAVTGRAGEPDGLFTGEVSSAGVTGEALEWLVHSAADRPALKAILSPDGSTRQQYVRRAVNWARRRIT